MKLTVEMGTIGDGSVKAAIRYCQDLEIEGSPFLTVIESAEI